MSESDVRLGRLSSGFLVDLLLLRSLFRFPPLTLARKPDSDRPAQISDRCLIRDRYSYRQIRAPPPLPQHSLLRR